ncbi:Nucleoside 5-triphosphatase RdgB (dHAPTP, dITP, XTP-specific) [Labilithrix luteola]|uniref:dITP/XTP pyrophosphatase n=1 Tax=Labilithrix luteola TaxID=1391654 RepID=A0A0K1PWE2_9BACT|nr:RdgB/HAM1 family non-canonical purine NTP pyrophosphatase [Labilithrix luteola]AKU97459.1 Nucleoside 5-triphosphatase RdgB (dHAPTP, dITP, XTP-specific) [Labilithrix luteola]
MTTHALVLATKNRGKIEELRALLRGLDIQVLGLGDVIQRPFDVVEDGATFEANALKKARAVAAATTMLTLADDSGLEVDVLGGAPGVRSARYAAEKATDAQNNDALVAALMAHATVGGRGPYKARFRCVLALVDPFVKNGEPFVVDGTCEGTITTQPRGTNGFGYDPLFVASGSEKTMAELSDDEKNRISHRAQAFAKMRLVIEKVLAERDEAIRKVCG